MRFRSLEVEEEQTVTCLRRNKAAKWHQTQNEQETSQVDTLDFRVYITATHAFVKAMLRLGLRAPPDTCKN